MITAAAFDCFGTVFDMSNIDPSEIEAYVKHVHQNDFTPFEFPQNWFELKPHKDSVEGINLLQSYNIKCIALSNGSKELISKISNDCGIKWDHIVDLINHKVYKPHIDAYYTVQKDLGISPNETLMVTANPTFGDVEGSAAIGMTPQIIRHGYPNTIIELLDIVR